MSSTPETMPHLDPHPHPNGAANGSPLRGPSAATVTSGSGGPRAMPTAAAKKGGVPKYLIATVAGLLLIGGGAAYLAFRGEAAKQASSPTR